MKPENWVWLTVILLMVFSAISYVRHLIWTVLLLTAAVNPTIGQMVFAVIGAFVPPLGVIHGILLLFGIAA